MKNYITPMVLAAAVGMCGTARPVQRIVLISGLQITPATADELRLPVGTNAPEDTTDALLALLESRNLSVSVESEADARASRFHELVDREFLEILTPEERQELEVLTKWRDDQKTAFYQNVAFE